jgi:hypothetical protein
MSAIGIGVIVAMAFAAFALGLMMRRFLWRGRLVASGHSAEVAGDSAALDVRLDEELTNLD